jgi:alanine racemase
MSRNTTATILLDHIKANYWLANQWAPNSKNIAIIKANAYGHGMASVAHHLKGDVAAFGVAIFDEAMLLRNEGITNPLLVLQGVNSQCDLMTASENDLWITVHNIKQVEELLATPLKKAIKISIKLDTGMHRLGLNQQDFINAVVSLENCDWVNKNIVLSSHFSSASNLISDESQKQIDIFLDVVKRLNQRCENNEFELSLANSPALASLPESLLDWNRPGIMLYGSHLFDTPHLSDKALKAAMIFEAKVIGLIDVNEGESVGYNKKWTAKRASIIATLSVGYGDGYPRHAKNGTPVFIKQQIAPLVGCVSMDLISIDVTDIKSVAIGDMVELWGENISVNEVAKFSDTVGYDLLTGITQRVKRIIKR